MNLDFEDGIEIKIEDEIEFKIDEVEIITPPEIASIPEQSWAKMTEEVIGVTLDDAEIDEVKIVVPKKKKKKKKKEKDTGTGRFNITANPDGVSVDVDEEVKKKVKKEKQRKINTKAIRRDGWLDDIDNKR